MRTKNPSTSRRRLRRAGMSAALAAGALLAVGAAATTASASGSDVFGTRTTLSASSNPVLVGQAVTITASVGSPHGGGPTSGSVTFNLPDSLQCSGGNTISISSQMAQCSIAAGSLPSGKVRVRAAYSGGGAYLPSNSRRPLVELVDDQATTVSVAPSADPVVTGQDVSFTATVTPGETNDDVLDNVVFRAVDTKGKRYGCSSGNVVALDNNQATCSFAAGLGAAGSNYTVSAQLQGDPNGKTVTTGSAAEVVDPAPTNVALSVSPGTPKAGENFTATAHVTPVAPATGTPTGLVQFSVCQIDNDTCAGEAVSMTASDYGEATYTVSGGLPVDSDTQVTAVYEGTSDYSYSLNEQTIKVVIESVTVVLQSSSNPSANGAQVTFNAGVTAEYEGSTAVGPPTGAVTFTFSPAGPTCEGGSNSITLDNDELDEGLASCVIPSGQLSSASSPYTVTASYPSDGNYGSGHATLTQTVS